MSLLRLLTAGKSLVGLKSAEIRYRFTDPRGMPRFGAKRNPFRATTLPDAAQASSRLTVKETGTDEVVSSSAERARPGSSEPPTVEVPRKQSRTALERLRVPFARLTFAWLSRQAAHLKSVAAARRLRTPSPAPPKVCKPVQGELSLEKVRVMRNDLRDSDLEVIARRPPARPVQKEPPEGTIKRTPNGAWGRVAGRLFGTGKI
jgi:hypothetical protein